MLETKTVTNGSIAKQIHHICHDTLPWHISFSLDREGNLGLRQSHARAVPRCSIQRAGVAPPHAEGDASVGVTSDQDSFAFICDPACRVGGVPLTRAMIPWPRPEASL